MYTVLGSVLVAVLPFEETTTGRDSRLSCFLSFRLPSPLGRTTFLGNSGRGYPCYSDQPCAWRIFPPERRQITRPQIMADPFATWLRFKISVSSIDPCLPFRAKRKDQAAYKHRRKHRLKID